MVSSVIHKGNNDMVDNVRYHCLPIGANGNTQSMPKHPYPKHPNKSEREVKTMEINKSRSDQRNEIDNLYFHPHGGSHDNRWPNLLSHVIIIFNLV